MAGDIQEPFRPSFQVDSIHSESISFGRFETEHLSWKRRSSFSHNRYLEEVKKYFRPGSVAEKKAYFEAHFKRKALLSQRLSDSQKSTGYQTSKNDSSDSVSHRDENEHNGGDSLHYDEDTKVEECERDEKDTSYIETKFDHAPQDRAVESQLELLANDVSSVTLEHVAPKAVEEEKVFENINRETAADLSCEAAHLATDTQYGAKEGSPRVDECHESCLKVGKIPGSKFEKPKVKAFADITQSSTKKPAGPVKGLSHSINTEKSLPTHSITRSICQSLKIKGSISFGRFENEHLSWEMRSSFSHKRYLEEVKKYFRPGSIAEKKAYFEARFKRKSLLSQSLSDSQKSTGYQTSENDSSDSVSHRDEYEHNGVDSLHYDEDTKVEECERDGKDTSYIETKFDHAPRDRAVEFQLELLANDVSSVTLEHVAPKAVEEEKVFENINRETAADLSCVATDTQYDAKEGSPRVDVCHESCLKVGKIPGSKFEKLKVKAFADITQSSTKKPAGPVKGLSHSINTEKSRPTPSNTRSIRQSLKIKEFEKLVPKVIHDKSLEKRSKIKNIVKDKPSVSDNVVSKARQNSNRPKVAKNVTQPEMKPSSVPFMFKSDERAERRKEFFMKMEEKMCEKEAKKMEIQAKRQEMTEAEIKMLRKSLNFKATPLSSFYHEAGQRGQTKNKAISNNNRSKVKTKSPNHVRVSERSFLSHHKAIKDKNLSKTESMNKSGVSRVSAEAKRNQTEPMILQKHRKFV